MKFDEIVAWYQKKIGTYDKQQWEKTVEQRILDGFNSVTLKNTKLKTDLIDVDLVRGSTFPKAKPKQSLFTVIRLAILRYLLLPLYAQWWVKQTSPKTFAILLHMYITQMIAWAVYTFNEHRLSNIAAAQSAQSATINGTIVEGVKKPAADEHIVSLSDLLIPMALSLLLSFIHSQIVATNTATSVKCKRRRFSNTNLNGKPGKEVRIRRRKKLVRSRTLDSSESVQTQPSLRKLHSTKRSSSCNDKTVKIIPYLPPDADTKCSTHTTANDSENSNNFDCFHSTVSSSTSCTRNPRDICSSANAAALKLDLNTTTITNDAVISEGGAEPSASIKKCRNVNWHSPIDNFACTTAASSTQEKQQQTSPQSMSSASTSTSNATTTNTSEANSPHTNNNSAEDGEAGQRQKRAIMGGSSGSSSSKSGSGSGGGGSPNKTVRIDDCVQEFYDDLISRTDRLLLAPPNKDAEVVVAGSSSAGEEQAHRGGPPQQQHLTTRRNICEDDGFESLNGKSSSGEETHHHQVGTAIVGVYVPPVLGEDKLRLRLNAGPNADKAIRGEELNNADGQSKTNALYRQKLQRAVDELENRPLSTSDARSQMRKISTQSKADVSSGETDEEGDDGEIRLSPTPPSNASNYNECTTSATEWLGVTTNSDECSYSSELDNTDDYKNNRVSDEEGYDIDFTPTTILNPHGSSDRISCTLWEQREIKKAQLSVLEISSCIIERVESMPETNDYIYLGLCFSFLLSLIPSFCRLCEVTIDDSNASEINYFDLPKLLWEKASFSFYTIFRFAFGNTQWERTVLIISIIQRLYLTMTLFIIFAVAERTFKQRFLYAKLFSHLTSSRRARKSNVPHFRLNKVRNIKTWLSVRSYLKKRGPQRSVDVIVSAAFIVTLLLLAFLSVEWLKDSVHLHSHLNLEALMWSATIGIFLVRFMTLGNKIHHKYRSVSVLITEQINLYLQIEQKPKKKDELMVSNSVLKLAADLLKELETPFKISGLSANPYLFTTVKVVILSALSGVLSEMLGFKLKLHKIKIK